MSSWRFLNMSYAAYAQVATNLVRNVVKKEVASKYAPSQLEMLHKTRDGARST